MNSLYHHICGSSITLRDAALVIAGVEPQSCFVTLDSVYGPFDTQQSSEERESQIFAAKKYYELLKEDLYNPKSYLNVIKFVAT